MKQVYFEYWTPEKEKKLRREHRIDVLAFVLLSMFILSAESLAELVLKVLGI